MSKTMQRSSCLEKPQVMWDNVDRKSSLLGDLSNLGLQLVLILFELRFLLLSNWVGKIQQYLSFNSKVQIAHP